MGAVGYYLDQEVRFDTTACYLGRPSNEIVQKIARLETVDSNAPDKLSPEQKVKLNNHPTVIRLIRKSKDLTERLHGKGFRPISTAEGTAEGGYLYAKKKRAEARLNRFKTQQRSHMIVKARKQHFRKAPTMAFDSQFSNASTESFSDNLQPTKPIEYNIPERAEIVELVCKQAANLTDQEMFDRRIRAIEARAALCNRQEIQRRGRPKFSFKQEEPRATPEDSKEDIQDIFPLVCKPTQCIFCLGKEGLSYL
jgi:hypothetical protein